MQRMHEWIFYKECLSWFSAAKATLQSQMSSFISRLLSFSACFIWCPGIEWISVNIKIKKVDAMQQLYQTLYADPKW